MKLTDTQIDQVVREVLTENRELASAILRAGGDKEDYKWAYDKWLVSRYQR